jgi:hypothetical protein
VTTLNGLNNIVEIPRDRHVLLASYAPAAGDFASSANRYWGPDGAGGFTVSTTATSVGLFDVRAFRQVLLTFTGTFGNAVTMEGALAGYVDPTPSTAILIAQHYTSTAASGGTLVIMAGFGNPVAASAAAAANLSNGAVGNVTYTTAPVLFPYYRVKTFNSNATGTITNGGIYLYGIK